MLAIKSVSVYVCECVCVCLLLLFCLLVFFSSLVYHYNKLILFVFFLPLPLPLSLCELKPLNVDDHLFVDVGVAHHRAELFEGNFAVLVLVGEHNGLVDDLLQLGVLQVVADHHF